MDIDVKSKYLLDQFQITLEERWDNYRITHEIANNNQQFITYLVDQNIIDARTIRKYTIIHEYLSRMREAKNSKSAIVNLLSRRYQVSERSVWYLLSTITTKKQKQPPVV